MNSEPENNFTPTPGQSPAPAPSSPQKQSNKKAAYGVFIGIIVLLLIVIGLLVALLLKNNDDTTSNTTDTDTSQQANNDDKTSPEKKVIKTIATDNKDFEVLIYEPRQTGSNTTIEYGIRNKCEGCEDSKYTSAFTLLGYSATAKDGAYLLDEAAGTKYSPITDEDGDQLATKSCGGYIKPGNTKECFISFTKVPSGSTISIVLGDKKIDDVVIN